MRKVGPTATSTGSLKDVAAGTGRRSLLPAFAVLAEPESEVISGKWGGAVTPPGPRREKVRNSTLGRGKSKRVREMEQDLWSQ